MWKLSFAGLVLSVLVTIAGFLVQEICSFRVPEGRRSLPLRLDAAKPNQLHEDLSLSESSKPRRAFLTNLISNGAAIAGATSFVSLPAQSVNAAAPATDVVSAGTIKVTAIAHTFLTTGSTASPKPVRENDATRFFTNARVVYIFEGSKTDENLKLAQEVTDLTTKRKAEKGPGVTPGNLRTLTPDQLKSKETIVSKVVDTAKQMPDGDVLVVGPIPSGGTADDGKLLAGTASGLGTFVGGKRESGVISVLLNGPTENLKLVESGFPASELLWYSLPAKK